MLTVILNILSTWPSSGYGVCVCVCVCVCVYVYVFIYRVIDIITIENVCEILLIKPQNTTSIQTDLPYISM